MADNLPADEIARANGLPGVLLHVGFRGGFDGFGTVNGLAFDLLQAQLGIQQFGLYGALQHAGLFCALGARLFEQGFGFGEQVAEVVYDGVHGGHGGFR